MEHVDPQKTSELEYVLTPQHCGDCGSYPSHYMETRIQGNYMEREECSPLPFSAGQYLFCILLIPDVTAPFGTFLSLDSAKPHRKRCGFLDFCGLLQLKYRNKSSWELEPNPSHYNIFWIRENLHVSFSSSAFCINISLYWAYIESAH